MTFHLLWNVLRTTSFLWPDVPMKIQNLQLALVASLAHPSPQHSPLLLGGVVSSVQGAWGEVLSVPSFHPSSPSSLPPLPAHGSAFLSALCPRVSLPETGWPCCGKADSVSETNSRQSVAAAHVRHCSHVLSVTELRLSLAFCVSSISKVGRRTAGQDLVVPDTHRYL